MHKLACPKCSQEIEQIGNSYKCCNNHCYDIAKQKYINVLLNPVKATNNPGDSKESLIARQEYLDKDYYKGILNQVIEQIKICNKDNFHLIDIGCGQGYYTKGFYDTFGNHNTYYGLDISKIAIQMATKYTKDIYWLVANSKAVPVLDHSMDIITALFTVVNNQELDRILKEDGFIIHVTANPNHLIEIKELIYDEIKVKSDEYLKLPFNTVNTYDYTEKININNRDDALNLLKMTPHYYHIKSDKRHVLDTLNSLNVTIDIKITIYQK